MKTTPLIFSFVMAIVFLVQTSSLVGEDLDDIIHNVTEMGDGSVAQARLEAQRQAEGIGPRYRSYKKDERKSFSGEYVPPELPDDKKGRYVYGLALFSDDGSNVTIKGSQIHTQLQKPQHLPDLEESFHVLPVAVGPGQPINITVDYSNTIYNDDAGSPEYPDVDGCALFLYLIPIELAVDANRDGQIQFGRARDRTEADRPFRFWCNDDNDGTGNGTEILGGAEDSEDNEIRSKRDLEDFARLWLRIGGLHKEIAAGTVKIGLKWRESSDPAIKLYRAFEANGRTRYLERNGPATSQTSGDYSTAKATVTGTGAAVLPTSIFSNLVEQTPNTYFLFEGVSEGKGQLVVTLHTANGTEMAEGPGVWLDLLNITSMYERALAAPEVITSPHDYVLEYPPDPQIGYASDPNGDVFVPTPDEAKQVIVFVHGINGPGGGGAAESYTGWANVSETIFKRLWHQGYKGRFALYKWPALTPAFPFQYNDSEYRAFKSGRGLAHFLAGFPSDYKKGLYSFSQGGVVCGSALTIYGGTVDNYIVSQGAIPAGCYDASDSINSYDLFDQREQQIPTPDTTAELGYRGYLTNLNVSGSVASFYNTADYALKTGRALRRNVSWEGNQIDYKPNWFVGRHYEYDASEATGERCKLRINESSTWRYVVDIHESMSFVARPRSEAVGASAVVGGSIRERYNVGEGSDSNFGPGSRDHGGQFNRRIQQTWSYYESMLRALSEE